MCNSFVKVRNAVDLREKLLLRQLDVLSQNKKVKYQDVNFVVDNEELVLELLRNYGIYQNIDCYLPYLENEDYICPNKDQILFDKSFHDDEENYSEIRCNALDNRKITFPNDNIISITLNESKQLIKKTSDLVSSVANSLKLEQQPKDQKNIDKTEVGGCQGNSKSTKQSSKVKNEDNKLKRNDTTTSSKKKTLKNISNLTLNNCCNGIINLRNISNLTINTCKQTAMQSAAVKSDEQASVMPCQASKKNAAKCDAEFISPECNFYQRLISENEVLKNHIVKQSVDRDNVYSDPIATACMSPSASGIQRIQEERDDGTFSINSTQEDTSSITDAEDGFPMIHMNSKDALRPSCSTIGFDNKIEETTTKNIYSPTAIGDHHPPIIQCWLNKMCLETEIEPQNLEFLEFRNII